MPQYDRRNSSPIEREADFQAAVVELAQLTGWLVYHCNDARRSTPGWPDLALCRPPRLLLVELKTTRGRLRPEQRVWLAALTECTGVEVAVWRPADWPMIERTLVAGTIWCAEAHSDAG